MIQFLRDQGYIVEVGHRPDEYTVFLETATFTERDALPLLAQVEGTPGPLVRFGRWPNGARSALAISGDLEALTIWDYALRGEEPEDADQTDAFSDQADGNGGPAAQPTQDRLLPRPWARIGPNVSMGPGSVIIAREIEIGEGATIGFGTFLKARKVVIGRYARIGSGSLLEAESITIGEDAKINEQVFLGGLSSPESHFRLGARTILMQHTFINAARPVTIGDDTGIGGRCSIFTHGSWQNMLEGYPVTFAPVTIGNNVWIPWQVFIMPGVTIGDGATVGAGSLVARDIPAGSLAVGSPAKVIRTADQYPVRPDHDRKIEMLRAMLHEFQEQLEYEGLSVQREGQAGSERITVTDRRRGRHALVVCYEPDAGLARFVDAEAVLSLPMLPDAARHAIAERGALWADLERKQRGGPSTPVGEEIVEFLKRFGVHLARA